MYKVNLIVEDSRMRFGPYDHYDTEIVDVGHADKIFVVKSEDLNKDRLLLLQEIERLKKLLKMAVFNSRPDTGRNEYRFNCVANSLGVGSDTAVKLCNEFGKDPYEFLYGGRCKGCREFEEDGDI